MRKYIIRFNISEVLMIIPVADGSQVMSTSQLIITSLERAKIMLDALGVDTQKIDDYKEEPEDN